VSAPHELWARIVWAAIDMAELGGLDTAAICEGLPFDPVSVHKLKRVTWDDYATICTRMGEQTGDGLDDLLEGTYHQVLPEVRNLASRLVSPKALARFLFEVIDPIMFPPVDFKYEDLGGRELRVTSLLREGARPCEAWFYGGLGALRGVPRHLNLPPAEILSSSYGPDFSIVVARMPESRTLAHRTIKAVSNALRIVVGIEKDGTPVDMTVGDPASTDPLEARLDPATSAWKLTPRQTDVLRLVARGDANKDIAAALGCAENTIELHVTGLLRRVGVSSRTQLVARFWSETWT